MRVGLLPRRPTIRRPSGTSRRPFGAITGVVEIGQTEDVTEFMTKHTDFAVSGSVE